MCMDMYHYVPYIAFHKCKYTPTVNNVEIFCDLSIFLQDKSDNNMLKRQMTYMFIWI